MDGYLGDGWMEMYVSMSFCCRLFHRMDMRDVWTFPIWELGRQFSSCLSHMDLGIFATHVGGSALPTLAQRLGEAWVHSPARRPNPHSGWHLTPTNFGFRLEEPSPQWLKELKSKKRQSLYENQA